MLPRLLLPTSISLSSSYNKAITTMIKTLVPNLQPSSPSNLTPSARKAATFVEVVPFPAPAPTGFCDAKVVSGVAEDASVVVGLAFVRIPYDTFDVDTPSFLVGGESEIGLGFWYDCVPICFPLEV